MVPPHRRSRSAAVVLALLLVLAGYACNDSNPTTPSTSTTTTVPSSGAAVSLSPASLTFTITSTDPQTVTLTNSGTDVLAISSVVASGNFAETDNCVGSIAVGSTCTINVMFVPTAPGTSGVVTITDNASNSPQSVTLTGPALTNPSAVLTPTALTFPSQAVGTTSASQTVTLTNPINGLAAPLTISSIGTVGDFGIADKTCGRLLAAGASCSIRITFTPSAPGPQVGLLAVFDNAPGSQQGVPLTGTGR
jgi:hypothetical protein